MPPRNARNLGTITKPRTTCHPQLGHGARIVNLQDELTWVATCAEPFEREICFCSHRSLFFHVGIE